MSQSQQHLQQRQIRKALGQEALTLLRAQGDDLKTQAAALHRLRLDCDKAAASAREAEALAEKAITAQMAHVRTLPTTFRERVRWFFTGSR